VLATIANGLRQRGGFFTLLVRSGGVQDVAGNGLDGDFFGSFPSGNGIRGGDFVARLDTFHNIVFAPGPIGSTVSPLTPGSPVAGRNNRLQRAQAAREAAAARARASAVDRALERIEPQRLKSRLGD
jgi:hypothetical protein